jgi:hypothetical protein
VPLRAVDHRLHQWSRCRAFGEGKIIDGHPSTEDRVKKELEDFKKWSDDFIIGA